MRGYVEESEEVKTLRALRQAATSYSGHYLTNSIHRDEKDAELAAAAIAYAATQPRPRKPKKAGRAGG